MLASLVATAPLSVVYGSCNGSLKTLGLTYGVISSVCACFEWIP